MKVRGDLDVYGGLAIRIAHFRDEKASGTDGGTLTQDAWNTRTLNTTKHNTAGASLSSNQVTLPKGRYYVDARCPGMGIDDHKARLFDITNNITLLVGSSEFAPAASTAVTNSVVKGIIILSGTTVVELQHYATSTNSGADGGDDTGISGINEVYSELVLLRF